MHALILEFGEGVAAQTHCGMLVFEEVWACTNLWVLLTRLAPLESWTIWWGGVSLVDHLVESFSSCVHVLLAAVTVLIVDCRSFLAIMFIG